MCKSQSLTANVQRNKHAYERERGRKSNSADTQWDDSSNNTFNRRACAAITERQCWNSERWWADFTSPPGIGQPVCHLWVPYSADANFLINSIFHSPPSRRITLPSSFLHHLADHNKDKLINLGWALLAPRGPMTAGLSLRPSLELWLFVLVPSFHLLNNMSVVGSFVTRNRYSTEASEWGKEEWSLLNLIFSKCVCVYTRACECIHVFILKLGGGSSHSWAQLVLPYH